MQQPAKQPPRLFICYRRDGGSGHAVHLSRYLRDHLDGVKVFMDTDIEPGEQFARKIESETDSCEIFIALISTRWHVIEDKAGRRRLDDPRDFVRREIETALSRQITLIPVLLDGVDMPPVDELPEKIAGLCAYQSFPLRNECWDDDAARLVRYIERKFTEPSNPPRKDASRLPSASVEPRGGTDAVVLQDVSSAVGSNPVLKWVLWFASLCLVALVITTLLAQAKAKKIKIDLVKLPAGTFTMGSTDGHDNERPVSEVTFKKPFYIGRYEVTQKQWKDLMGSESPSVFKGDNLPVENITWDDAEKFIVRLNQMKDGYRYYLSTEAEWEYACKAKEDIKAKDYKGVLNRRAWYDGAAWTKSPHPPGQLEANKFELYDMQGNVWEWCKDGYRENYAGPPQDGSVAWEGDSSDKRRALRGGSFYSNADNCRCSFRRWEPKDDTHNSTIGLRVVARPDPTLEYWLNPIR